MAADRATSRLDQGDWPLKPDFLKEQFEQFFDELPAALLVKDAHSRIVLMNRACEDVLGAAFADLRGTDGSGWFPAEQVEAFVDADRAAFAGRTTVESDAEFWNARLRRNRVAHTVRKPVFDEAGEPRYLVCVTVDVTEARQAEQTLRMSEDQLRALFELAPLGIALTDLNGRYLEFNEEFRRICGYEEDELKALNYWLLTPKEFEAQETRQLELLFGSGRYGPYEKIYHQKSGRRIPVRLSGVLVTGRDGNRYIWSIVEDITERKRVEAERRKSETQISRLAYYDPLTGLPNRRMMLDRIGQALVAGAGSGAVLFLDFDNFKTINDTLGHDAGDLLLQEISRRLRQTLRKGDNIARLGGDEFVVLLEQLGAGVEEAAAAAHEIGGKLLAALSRPYPLRGKELSGSVSIGVALFGGGAQDDVHEILKRADVAMYEAKRDGRNALRFFDPAMQASIERTVRTEAGLRAALKQRQFELHFQRRVQHNGLVSGAEALLRWRHPEQGLVEPPDFIAVAVSTGLILPIGQWVLESACRQLKKWERRPQTRDLILSINVSGREFRREDFADNVKRTLARCGASPHRLELEIAEGALLGNIDELVVKMQALRQIGVSFALDDFGTGYSSLYYLKTLPLNRLKIDRSFVRDVGTDPNDEVIVQTIIRMGQTLGIEVIAKGVETDAQRALLEQYGCRNFQGFLFGRAVGADEFERELRG
ncbi:MAG: EAL domain-containing protein [Nevskia sp.]|nr:EAL domain-containing protein [Nevskia sp.]